VYDELRSLARSRLAHNPGRNTLQPTALVHEAYLRITKRGETRWNGKGHFFAAAAEAMRQILVEQARSKSRLKRGGDRIREQLGAQPEFDAPTSPEDLLVIDEAVSELSRTDESLALIVKLRFFSGLSPDEIATLMGVSRRTVERRWRFAAALLRQRLEDPDSIGTNAGSNRHLLENETSPWESESA
jgi:RNA polymerase sigma factor (TIGR02999 family)